MCSSAVRCHSPGQRSTDFERRRGNKSRTKRQEGIVRRSCVSSERNRRFAPRRCLMFSLKSEFIQVRYNDLLCTG